VDSTGLKNRTPAALLILISRYAKMSIQKEQPPQYKGLAHIDDRNSPSNTPMFYKGVFLCPFLGLYRKTLLTVNENKGK